MKTHPNLRFLFFHVDRASLSGVLIGAILALAPAAGRAQSELIRNGTFDDVLAGWTVPPEVVATGEDLYVHDGPGGHLDLHVPDYTGTLLRQNLNVPGIANQTLHGSMDLKLAWPVDGKTMALSVEYTLTDGTLARAAVLNPDNSTITPDTYTTVTGDFTFPANADRLLAVAIDRDGFGMFSGDNVSLTSSLPPEALPSLGRVSPTRVSYGDAVEIAGTGFGATQGQVLIGDSDAGITIGSWSDTLIQITVDDPCTGGPLVVVSADKTRTGEQREIGITSPYFTATRFRPGGFGQQPEIPVAISGQTVFIDVNVDCHNGCAPTGGIVFSVDDASSGTPFPSAINPARSAGDGGSHIGIDTTGLSSGLHTFTIKSSATGFAPRTFPLTIDVRTPGALTFEYQDPATGVWTPAPNPIPFTKQGIVPIRSSLLDDAGNDITPYAQFTYSICNPSVIQAYNTTTPWDSATVMPQDNGSCIITVHGPGNRTWGYPLTVTVPDDPKITNYTLSATRPDGLIDNSGDSTFEISVTASQAMIGFSWNNPGGVVQEVTGDYSNENKTYTATLKVNKDTSPGTYRMDVTATIPGGGASRSKVFTVVNTPSKGMVEGHLALIRNPNHWQGATGTVEFWDAGTGTKAFECALPWSESWDYQLSNIPPGTYKLLWKLGDGAGQPVPQWFANAYDHADAAEVVVAAGSVVRDANFFLDLLPATLSPPPPASAPVYVAGENKFQCEAFIEGGFSYDLYKSDTGAEGTWYKVPYASGGNTPGTTATFTDSNATGARAFYKIIRK